jgi:ubiquinol-cytochrome c reductase cytochrome b/c1 subunit
MAHDVTTFLTWSAEPKLEERKRMGFKVIIYLLILAFLFYFTNKSIWRDTH